MLEKIISIDNVGVFKKGVPQAIDLEKVTLIYADNARGKSTLAAIARACANGDAAEMTSRKTVGATTDQKVNFRFKSPSGSFNAQFDGLTWSGGDPNLHVFNQDFVERNVYAGGTVSAEQRASLLELALGDAAVVQRSEFQKQSEIQRAFAGKVSAAEGALTGYRGGLTIDQFIALPIIDDVDAEISAINKQITEGENAARIVAKPELKTLPVPPINLDSFTRIATSQFDQLQDAAEALAKKHFAEHFGEVTERWVSAGLKHKPEPNCPFCGQKTDGLELLAAYKAYFNQAYQDHVASVATMKTLVTQILPTWALAEWEKVAAFNSGAAGTWEGVVAFTLPTIDLKAAHGIVEDVQKALIEIADQKIANPMLPAGGALIEAVLNKLSELEAMSKAFNTSINEINNSLADYKKSIGSVDLKALKAGQERLGQHKARHDPKVELLVEAIISARAEYKSAEKAKETAKGKLDQLMSQILASFQTEINAWLVKFGAPFKLKELKPTYLGGGVRSQYVIEVRGASVQVGPAATGQLSFQSALSEGDKRTLAFAFFLATLFADANKAHAVVVLDDVFTSLDRHRRHNTADAAVRVAHECSQLIALGHDAHFLRELKKRIMSKKVAETQELCLHRDVNDYSLVTKFELDEFCSSDYYKHYVLVENYIIGAIPPGQHLEVAKALRLLVEGHLHRSFPGHFKEGQTVGVALDAIKNAKGNSALARLQSIHPDLVTFNDFAAAYHHDTSGGHPRTDINDAELLHFAKAAIGFIQARQLW